MILHLHANRLVLKEFILVLMLVFLQVSGVMAGTITWTGASSDEWRNPDNWSPSVLPGVLDDIVIDAASLSANRQPRIEHSTQGNGWAWGHPNNGPVIINNLTIISGTLTLKNRLNSITVNGDVKIETNGVLRNEGSDLVVNGNWTNNGTYADIFWSHGNNEYYSTIEFGATSTALKGGPAIVGGTKTNIFNYVVIKGSVLLSSNLIIKPVGTTLSRLEVNGTLDPNLNKVSFTSLVTGGGFFQGPLATIKVKAATYWGNYDRFPTADYPNSIIDYAASTINQTVEDGYVSGVLNFKYGILQISGALTKSLEGNTSIRGASSVTELRILAGILDLKSYTLDRETGITGGTLSMVNGSSMLIGNTGTERSNFPQNFNVVNLGFNSTVNYYGGDQVIANPVYGNLHLTGTGSKRMPSATMTIAGNLESDGSASFRARASINIGKDVKLGQATNSSSTSSFKGSKFVHSVGGNWINNADFAGDTSTVRFFGTNNIIERTSSAAVGNNEFYNLVVESNGTIIKVLTGQTLEVKGDLSTSGAGTLTQSAGSLTMSGVDKTISGTGIVFNDFIAKGSTSTTTSFTVNGDFTTNSTNTFVATGGTITMSGVNKKITGTGNTTFFALRIDTKRLTDTSFNIDSDLSGNGLTASKGTITFRQRSTVPPTFAGIHNLFNVLIDNSNTSSTDNIRRMVTNSNMGVAGTLSVNGALDVTTNTPNTVTYNGTVAQILGNGKTKQTVAKIIYHNITFENDGYKVAEEGLKVNGDLSIKDLSNFNGGAFSHILYGNWINDGTARIKNSRFVFADTKDVSITGNPDSVTVLKTLVINKSKSAIIPQGFNITTDSLNLDNGSISTGIYRVRVNKGRRGDGWVIGTIERYVDAGYAAGTEYFFNGEYVSVSFESIQTSFKSVTMTSILGAVPGFKSGIIPINRMYNVKVEDGGQYTNAKLRLQYQDSELNGNTEKDDEDGLQPARSINGNSPWAMEVKIPKVGVINEGNDTEANWVAAIITSSINDYWTLAAKSTLFKWQGDISYEWRDKRNWREVTDAGLIAATRYPGPIDIAEIGGLEKLAPTYKDPVIEYAERVKGVIFSPVISSVLTIQNDSLYVRGNLAAVGEANIQHTIDAKDKALIVNGNLILDEGIHTITLNKSTGGYVRINGSILQKGGTINLGTGTLKINGDYNFSGTAANFVSDITGNVIYDGGNAQTVANVSYGNLTINKAGGGVAKLSTNGSPYIKGNLEVLNGKLSLQKTGTGQGRLAVDGNLTVANNGVLESESTDVDLKGNWSKDGTFTPGAGTVRLIGAATQTVSGSQLLFDNLEIGVTTTSSTAASNIVKTAGDVSISGSLRVYGGTLNLGTYNINRSAVGGEFVMSKLTTLLLEASNFPANYNTVTLDPASTVVYQGTNPQSVAAVKYGNLETQKGGADAKTIYGPTEVAGNLVVGDGSTLNGNEQTITLSGDFYNLGTFNAGLYTAPTPPNGTLILASNGIAKKITGKPLVVNNMIINTGARYSLEGVKPNNVLTINGNIDIVGNGYVYSPKEEGKDLEFDYVNNGLLDAKTFTVYVSGNFKNQGILQSGGSATFLGNRVQNLQLLAPLLPSGGVNPTVYFMGSKSPVLNSTSAPLFATVVVGNTEGVTTSIGWTIGGALKVLGGGVFNGGPYTHSILTAIDNEGTITSSGIIKFIPKDQGVTLPSAPFYPLKFGLTSTSFVSTGTLVIGGSVPVAMIGVIPASLNNLVVSNINEMDLSVSGETAFTGLTLYGSDWNITGNMTINPGAKFKGGIAKNYKIGGNLLIDGTLDAKDANFTFTPLTLDTNGDGAWVSVSGPGSASFKNFTIDTGGNVTLTKDITIYGNFNHNGKGFDGTKAEVKFMGTAASAINAIGTNKVGLRHLYTAKTNETVTVNAPIESLALLTVESGILDATDKSLSVASVAVTDEQKAEQIFSIADGATFKVGGSKTTLPLFATNEFTPASNVIYYGGDQEIKNVQYGNLRLENTLGLDKQKTFLPADGTTKIAGSFVLDKTATSGVARDRVTAPATIEYNGGDQQIAGIDYNNLSLTTGGAKTLNDIVGVADAFTNTGAATVDAVTNATTVNYNGTVAQNVLPLNYHHLEFNNSGVKILLAGETGIAGDFTVTTPSTNLAINATTVNFNGDGAQKVAAVDYDNLRFSVKGKKTITGTGATVNVKNSLLLSTGSVSPLADNVIEVITGSNKLVLNQASGTISEAENAYVTGFVETQRTMTTALENFGGLGIEITPTLAPGLVTIVRETGRAVGPSNNSILRNYSFVVADVNSKLDARVTFHYFTHELNTLTESTLQLFNSLDGVKWYSHPNSIPNETNNDLIATGVPTLRRMTLASTNTPLPVELIYFKAEKNGSEALLTWETATEEDNKGFGIEVSEDGFSYREIGFVSQGTGTTRAAIKYTFKDVEQGKNGMRYYRLRQQDFDGKVTYYGPRTLAFEIVKEVAVYAYPNPFQSNLTVNVSAVVPGQALVEVYNVTGQRLVSQSYQVKAGVTSLPLSVEKSIAQSGIYFVTVEINGQKHRLKVVRK